MFTRENLEASRRELADIRSRALNYFTQIERSNPRPDNSSSGAYDDRVFWDDIQPEDRQLALEISRSTKQEMAKVASFAQSSPLFGQLDINGLRFATKSMLASLQLYEYHYSDEQPIAGEHGVYGVRPPEEYEESVKIADARKSFLENCDWAIDHLDLLSPSEHELPSAIMASQASVISKIRRNTAFIIMRMGGPRTEDEDIKDCIKQVFREFGVRAVRADDVEHQDVITKRILDEIATSEFQIADLTGERPSVYYEVGYAHALGQRPILYRKSGTPLHFDLAVHNVPEYDNIRDLRGKLRKRLAAITGKPAKDNSQEG